MMATTTISTDAIDTIGNLATRFQLGLRALDGLLALVQDQIHEDSTEELAAALDQLDDAQHDLRRLYRALRAAAENESAMAV
jgi:hypothetical protein